MNTDYEQWLREIEQEHPDAEVTPTRTGCAVLVDDEIVDEYDYDPLPFAEQRVRY